MKQVLVDLLKENGFSEQPVEAEILKRCDGLILQREWEQEVEVLWHGLVTSRYSVRVFVNRDSGICHVTYGKDGLVVKDRWYRINNLPPQLAVERLAAQLVDLVFDRFLPHLLVIDGAGVLPAVQRAPADDILRAVH